MQGARRADPVVKTGFTIFDFVGVTDFHGDDEEQINGGFVSAGLRPDGSDCPRLLPILDVDDRIDLETPAWQTLDQHGRIVCTPEHEARAAELGVRAEA